MSDHPRRGLGLAGAFLALGMGAAAPATAHSGLHASEPADGAVLRAAPPAVVLAFMEPVQVTSLRLLDEAGRERPLRREGERTAATREARASVQGALPPGAYRIEWRGASADGHVGGGAVSFRIEPAR
jgi:methionine-rich copper-binding protein CopC